MPHSAFFGLLSTRRGQLAARADTGMGLGMQLGHWALLLVLFAPGQGKRHSSVFSSANPTPSWATGGLPTYDRFFL